LFVVYWPTSSKTWRQRKPSWNPAYSRFYYTAPNGFRSRRRKRECSKTCQQKMERRILQVVWSDRVMNAEVRQRTNVKDTTTMAHSLKRKWGGNRSVQMGTCCINVGRKNWQKENWATEDTKGRHVQERSRRTAVTSSQRLVRM
jgi:hypothetical protein